MINWSEVENQLVVAGISGAVGWAFAYVLELRKDMNAAFKKIRDLETKIGVKDAPDSSENGTR